MMISDSQLRAACLNLTAGAARNTKRLLPELLIFFVIASSHSALSDVAAQQSAPRLDVVAGMNLRAQLNAAAAPADNNGSYDFGAVSALDTPEVLHTFLLRNDSSSPLVLKRLQPSCGCTTAVPSLASEAFTTDGEAIPMNQKDASALQALVDRRAAAHLAARSSMAAMGSATLGVAAKSQGAEPPPWADTDLPTLPPGEETAVRVVVDLRLLAPGPISKMVFVYGQGSAKPLAVLHITGSLKSPISFSPATLNLGSITAGQSHVVTLTAHIDRRLAPSGVLPQLISSNPAVQITPDRVDDNESSASGMLSRSYRVTVPATFASGSLLSNIFYAADTYAPPAAINAPSTLLHNASVLLTGQVAGDVRVVPGATEFGTIPSGKAAVRQVVLSVRQGTNLDNARVASANSWLEAKIVDTPAGKRLQLTIDSDAPVGSLQSQVMITTANGQQLLLPVTASIQPTLTHS